MIEKLSSWLRNELGCLNCRLANGMGLIGIGVFMLAQSKKCPKRLDNYGVKSVATLFGLMGAARLADVNFRRDAPKNLETPTPETPRHQKGSQIPQQALID